MQRSEHYRRSLAVAATIALALTACPRAQETSIPSEEAAAAAEAKAAEEARAAEAAEAAAADVPAGPQLSWRERAFLDYESFKKAEPILYMEVRTAIPDDDDPEDPRFQALVTRDPRASAVLLTRIASAKEPDEVRAALANQLPYTRGDWGEGAAELIRFEPEATVRRQLIEAMHYAPGEHAVNGLRRGLVDEEPELRAEAARIACLVPAASALEVDLVSRLFEDSDWETRVEAARALGRLKLVGAYPALIGALDDRDGRVRLAVLVSLDQIDPEQTREHPRVEKATRDRSAQVAALAKRLRRGAPPTSAPRGPAPVRSAGQ